MKSGLERIYNGIIKENPVLVLMLGICPTLAVTTSASNGFGIGVSTMAVLIVSTMIISALRKVCAAGCIGCGLCVKQCQFGAVTLENNLARIDPDKCTGCGACAQKRPVKVISGWAVKSKAAVS